MAELEIDSRAFDAMLSTLAQTSTPATASVITNDTKVQMYWGVLEGGSGPGQRPWPRVGKRTVSGQDGRIFSSQAPEGFVRKYGATFLTWLVAEVQSASGDGLPDQNGLQDAVNRTAARVRDFLKTVVPVDSGEARDSLDVREGG